MAAAVCHRWVERRGRGSHRRARPWERTERRRGRMVTTMGVVTERIKERDRKGAAESWEVRAVSPLKEEMTDF